MTAARMLAEARRDLGMAGRPNAITREYAARHGAVFEEAPWCQMSITHWARVSSNADAVLPAGDRAYTVWHAEDGQRLGRWHPGTVDAIRKHARPGAVVFFDWGGTDSIPRIDHVGLVEVNLGDGRVQTIEGNTGDACKRRVRSASVIAGFWNPDYEEEDDVAAKDMWQHELPVPFGRPGNTEWQAGNVLVNAAKWALELRATVAAMRGELAAQGVVIREMAGALAQRDAEIDVEALVARIEAAIEGVTVRLDVPDRAGPPQ